MEREQTVRTKSRGQRRHGMWTDIASRTWRQARRVAACMAVLTATLMAGCSAGDGAAQQAPTTDAADLEAQAMELYAHHLPQALQLIDSAQAAGSMTAERADLLRATAYGRTLETPRLDSAIVIAERLLASKAVKEQPEMLTDILEVLVYATRQMEDYGLQLVYSTQLAEAYLQKNERVEALRTEAEVGAVLYRLGNTDKGLAKMDSVIHLLSPVRHFNEMDAGIIALKRKMGVVRDYPLIASAAQQMLERLEDYEQHPDDFHDGSLREPSDEERPGYVAFYRAQAWIYMAAAHAHLGQTQKARSFLDMAEQTAFGKTLSGKKMMAPTLCLIGEYDKMEAIYQELEALFCERGDTLTLDYAQLLFDRAKTAERQGRMAESIALWERHAQILQKAEERLLQGKANLYAARYHAQEQQRAIDRQQAALERKNMIATALAIGLGAMLAVLIYVLRQQRILRRKNGVLAREIYKATHQVSAPTSALTAERTPGGIDNTRRAKEGDIPVAGMAPGERYSDTDSSGESAEALSAASKEAGGRVPAGTEAELTTDEQLFRYISKIIIRDELFLDPSLDRQALCERFAVTKEQLGSAFAKGSPYSSLTQFLNDLRLSAAAKLLVDRPDLSIAEVARASGFARADTLTTNFKLRYTLTPTQYRAQQQ